MSRRIPTRQLSPRRLSPRWLSTRWRGSSKGVALVTVLFIVALLSALAVQLISTQALVVAQARHTFATDQSLNYALGGETFARQILFEDQQQRANFDSLDEVWAQALPPLELDNGVMEIQVRDLNSCFNLNSMTTGGPGRGIPGSGNAAVLEAPNDSDDEDAVDQSGRPVRQLSGAALGKERFKNLLRAQSLPDGIADGWIDWVDGDDIVNGFGAEDSDYLLAEPAYRASNQPAVHVSELRLIANIDPEHAALLRANVCVYPAPSGELKLNVNTASAAALQALASGVSPAQIEAFVGSPRALERVDELESFIPGLARSAAGALTVSSEYFEISVRADVGGMVTELTSVVRRDPGTGQITLLSRDFGKRFQSLVALNVGA